MSVNKNDMLDRILVYNMYNNGNSKTIVRKCSSKCWKKYGLLLKGGQQKKLIPKYVIHLFICTNPSN